MKRLRAAAWVAALCVATAAAAAEPLSTEPTTHTTATDVVTEDATPTTVSPPRPATTAGTPRLLLNKCCGPYQILDPMQRQCLPYANATRDVTDETQETVATLASRDYPWWLDSRVGGALGPDGRPQKMLQAAPPEAVVRYASRPCGPDLTAILWRRNSILYRSGNLKVNISLERSGSYNKKKNINLSPEHFCVDKTYVGKELHFVLLACPCFRVPCVRKCCNGTRMLTISPAVAMNHNVHCRQPFNGTWNATIMADVEGDRQQPTNVTYALLLGPFAMECAAGRTKIPLENRLGEDDMLAVMANGSLLGKVSGSPFLPQEYCVDYALSPGGGESFAALVCAENAPPKAMKTISKVYVVLYTVGVVFLLATLAVYLLLPSLRRPANAKALMCHIGAWAAALVMMCASRFITQVQTYSTCAFMAFTAQFFLLAAFFWLTVLCFDISRGFSAALRPLDSSAGAACRRVLLYSLFAWGGPALIVAVSASLNYAPDIPSWVLRPGIGEKGCWFTGTAAILAYYYGPVASLLVTNLAMFLYTMMQLRDAQREMALLKNDEGKLSGGALRRRRERLLLYGKLYSLMGVTWLLEVVAWAAGADHVTLFVVDTVNVLRAVGVFVACCCKRGVLSALRDRLHELCACGSASPPARGFSYTATTTLCTRASTPDALRLRQSGVRQCGEVPRTRAPSTQQ